MKKEKGLLAYLLTARQTGQWDVALLSPKEENSNGKD